ncbi:CARDB domain-containing protein [[Eubacterium] cellulosolvens]
MFYNVVPIFILDNEIILKDNQIGNFENQQFASKEMSIIDDNQNDQFKINKIITDLSTPSNVIGYNGLTKEVTIESADEFTINSNSHEEKQTEPYHGHGSKLIRKSSRYNPSPDDRTVISATSTYPWSSICKLNITFPFGGVYSGSGAVIDNFHVLTCGHCVYDNSEGGWASSIEVIPGYYGDGDGYYETLPNSEDDYRPYGQAWMTYMRTYNSWINSADQDFDFALITLDRNIGIYTGWMGRKTASYTSAIYTGTLNSAGYPGDKNNGEYMYFTSEKGKSATEYFHNFYLDIGPGQSGSPVWQLESDNRYILSVVTISYNFNPWNGGTRINQDRYDDLNTWTNADTAPTDYADLVDFGESYRDINPNLVAPGITNLEITNSIVNLGTGDANSFKISYYASSDRAITSSDYLIGTSTISSIDALTYYDSFWQGTIPKIPNGEYYIGWIIDENDDINEFDEDNNNAYITSEKITVDGSPPNSFTPTASPSSWSKNRQPTISFYTTDGESGIDYYEIKVDNEDFIRHSSPYTLPTLDDGIHFITVRAYDVAGNYIDETVEVYIDATPPVSFTPEANPANWTSNNQPEIIFSALDATSGIKFYKVKVDSGSFEIETSPFTPSALTDGIHTVTIRAYDLANNYREETIKVYIDTEAPTINAQQIEYGWYNADPGNIIDIDFENGYEGSLLTHAEYSINDDSFSNPIIIFKDEIESYSLEWNVPWQDLKEGENRIYIRVYDAAGNEKLLGDKIIFKKDTMAPDIVMGTTTYGWYNEDPGNVIDINFNNGGEGSPLVYAEYSINDDTFTQTNLIFNSEQDSVEIHWGVPWDKVNEGNNIIYIRLFDAAGNGEATTTSITFKKDTIKPIITVNIDSYGWYNKDPGNIIDVDCTNDGSGSLLAFAEYSINDPSFSKKTKIFDKEIKSYTNDWSIVWDKLIEGENRIYIRVCDKAGNMDNSGKEIIIKKDTVNPSLKIRKFKDEIFTTDNVDITWLSEDDTSGIKWTKIKIDTGDFVNAERADKHTYKGVDDGKHRVIVTVSDEAGNTVEDTIYFNVDTNIFSMSGPYKGAPVFIIIPIIVIITLLFLIYLRKRKQKRSKLESQLSKQPQVRKIETAPPTMILTKKDDIATPARIRTEPPKTGARVRWEDEMVDDQVQVKWEDEDEPIKPNFCPKCGVPTKGSKFCRECGHRLY